VPLLAQQDSAGRTPLHVCGALNASTAERIEMWQVLKSRSEPGALYSALKQHDAATGCTVVHWLVQHKQAPLLHRLLQSCANSECLAELLAVEDAQGISAVLLAQRIGHRDTLSRLEYYFEEVSCTSVLCLV
jgi:hypothetical protein